MKAEYNGKYAHASTETNVHASYNTDAIKNLKLSHVFVFLSIIFAILAFHFRARIKSSYRRFRERRGRYSQLSDGFQMDLEGGFSSNSFNLKDNYGDSRQGLDESAKDAISRIMEEENLDFDQARLQYTKRQFGKNAIGSDGTPLDPKTVTFS